MENVTGFRKKNKIITQNLHYNNGKVLFYNIYVLHLQFYVKKTNEQ
jgi:hypothetical protein